LQSRSLSRHSAFSRIRQSKPVLQRNPSELKRRPG
jgi:hypothetical protein